MSSILPCLLWSGVSSAADTEILTVRDLSVEYYKYEPGYRNPYFVRPEEGDGKYIQMSSGASLIWDINLLRTDYFRMYWDNDVHMDSDENPQVRHVGWEWEGGLSFWKLDFFQHHDSEHGLEYTNPNGYRFPVENRYGVRIHLIGEGSIWH